MIKKIINIKTNKYYQKNNKKYIKQINTIKRKNK